MLKLFNKKKKDNKGFTLVELVIVIAILAILVGLLAPQYTKYVEKSRKTADANNMDEIVKVIKVYAADPATQLTKGKYTVTMGDSTTTISANPNTDEQALKTEVEKSIPNYATTGTKSKKWGKDGIKSDIKAEIEVLEDGGTKVTYSPVKFDNYMKSGEAGTDTSK